MLKFSIVLISSPDPCYEYKSLYLSQKSKKLCYNNQLHKKIPQKTQDINNDTKCRLNIILMQIFLYDALWYFVSAELKHTRKGSCLIGGMPWHAAQPFTTSTVILCQLMEESKLI